MKLKGILILATLCLIICFALLQLKINSSSYQACDIVEVNDIYKSIESDLKTKSPEDIEKEYAVHILLKEDSDYLNELYGAMQSANIILDYLEGDILIGKIIFPSNSDSFRQLKKELTLTLWGVFGAIIIILYTLFFVIEQRILRPFRRLERFAEHISVGNLDIPLAMDRGNYFGAFTESFDMMREELKKARQGEYEANISKKELVAELSHDIKTPVATIKALCELLELKLTEEDALTKIHTINQKADVIDKLISNMFHATLEELDVLKIEPTEELSTIIEPMLQDLNHYGRIHIKNELPGCLIYCDKLRLNQVIDNIINNSYKYANTDIDVIYREQEKTLEIEIRDYGNNLSEGDLPLVFEKFYRGENAASHSGAGLGLYLAKQFMKGMGGEIQCFLDYGFVAVLTIKEV